MLRLQGFYTGLLPLWCCDSGVYDTVMAAGIWSELWTLYLILALGSPNPSPAPREKRFG